MDADAIIQSISTLGFPIVAFLLMFFKLNKTVESLAENVANQSKLVQLLLQKEKGQ